MTTIETAADELADLLHELAERLATKIRPRRVPYGHGLIGKSLKRRSPAGFVVDSSRLQILLPDGRLWDYSQTDHQHPSGRYVDVRADHKQFSRGHSHFGGTGFTFLGVEVGKYAFGVTDGNGRDPATARLTAVYNDGTSLRYVDPHQALEDVTRGIIARGSRVA